MIQPTCINLRPNKFSQRLHYYTFAINVDRFVKSCNTFYDLSNGVCIQDKTEDLNCMFLTCYKNE